MNIHLLHHWLVSMRGGEKVLEQCCMLFRDAPIHTLVYNNAQNAISDTIRAHDIYPSGLNKWPGAASYYKNMLPFFPSIIKKHDVRADFIFSSDAGMIKGINNINDAPHVCYCHSPPRYLWDLQDEYVENMSVAKKAIFKIMTPYLQRFDQESAGKVDHFIANSAFVKDRIKRIYGCDSTVIHPPVDLEAFSPDEPSEDFYLMVSALVPYKKVAMAVRAFNTLDKKLVVIGDGSERRFIDSIAKDNIHIMGAQKWEVVKDRFERCKAFIFPGVEDFGITPLEAQAAGKPVIAFKKGGALETVKEGETGLFFDEQSEESLINAVQKFEKGKMDFSSEVCRENAALFGPQRFRDKLKSFLSDRYPSYFRGIEWGC